MNETNSPNWAPRILENIALSGLIEQRRKRRWGIFFRFIFITYLIATTVTIFTSKKDSYEATPRTDYFGYKVTSGKRKHIAIIRLNGVISGDQTANAAQLSNLLQKAAHNPNVIGTLIMADSPGGSPVQSSLVYKTIQSIRNAYPEKKIITYIEDTCASGCYYIVSASDLIYADESSIVGSIGVISQSYGYEEAAKKLGIEPRTFTAGSNKDFMNPARPIRENEKAHLYRLLGQLHQNFITAVKDGRGDRLKADQPDLFSGLFWSGTEAKQYGLIDGISTPEQVIQDNFGDYPAYLIENDDRLDLFFKKLGVNASSVISQSIETIIQDKASEKILFK